MDILINLSIAALMGCLAAYFASKRKRSPVRWFFIGLLLGLIGIIILFLMPYGTVEGSEAAACGPEARTIAYTPPVFAQEEPKVVEKWFYLDKQHGQHGPVAVPELKKMYQESQVVQESYVWKEGMGDWKKLSDLPILLDILK